MFIQPHVTRNGGKADRARLVAPQCPQLRFVHALYSSLLASSGPGLQPQLEAPLPCIPAFLAAPAAHPEKQSRRRVLGALLIIHSSASSAPQQGSRHAGPFLWFENYGSLTIFAVCVCVCVCVCVATPYPSPRVGVGGRGRDLSSRALLPWPSRPTLPHSTDQCSISLSG